MGEEKRLRLRLRLRESFFNNTINIINLIKSLTPSPLVGEGRVRGKGGFFYEKDVGSKKGF